MINKKFLFRLVASMSLVSFIFCIAFILLQPKTFEYNGRKYLVGESFKDKDDCNTCSFDSNGRMICTLMYCEIPKDETSPIKIEFKYKSDGYHYEAEITKPTPCHTITTETVIRESYPEHVNLKFEIIDSGAMCAQVIDVEKVSGVINVSESAQINYFVNNVLIR